MIETSQPLAEVTVTGYGDQRRLSFSQDQTGGQVQFEATVEEQDSTLRRSLLAHQGSHG